MPEYVIIIIRSVFAFVTLLALTRWMGKTQVSQLTFFDYVVGITIGSIAASLGIDQSITFLNGGIGLLVWAVLTVLVSYIGIKSYWFRRMTDGEPTVIIKNGKVQENNLKKMRMTIDQLMLELREKNAFRVSDVEFAVMETNGELSVLQKRENQPLTPKDMAIQTVPEREPRMVVMDGHVMKRTLRNMGYDEAWLMSELQRQGIQNVEEVFIAQLDSSGALYVDRYDDEQEGVPPYERKPLLVTSLKKIQADLEHFANQAEDDKTKQVYQEQSQNLLTLIKELRPYL